MNTHGPTYIYAGAGSWQVSVKATQKMLESGLDARSIKVVESLHEIDRSTQLVVIPGGHASWMAHELGKSTLKIAEYVKNGGRFLGICAGAIMACETFIEKPVMIKLPECSMIKKLHNAGKLYNYKLDQEKQMDDMTLAIYPGKCIAPHIIKAVHDRSHPSNLCAVDVCMEQEGKLVNFKACHYSGPVFVNPPSEANVFLRYCQPVEVQGIHINYDHTLGLREYTLFDQKIYDGTPSAALSYPYGMGKTVLSGIHPEMKAESFSELEHENEYKDKFPQELLNYDAQRQALVDRIFKELDFNRPAT